MHDRKEGDGSRRGPRFGAGRRPAGLQLASAGSIDDVPTAGLQLRANRIGLGEAPLAPKLDPTLEKPLSFLSIRSSWL